MTRQSCQVTLLFYLFSLFPDCVIGLFVVALVNSASALDGRFCPAEMRLNVDSCCSASPPLILATEIDIESARMATEGMGMDGMERLLVLQRHFSGDLQHRLSLRELFDSVSKYGKKYSHILKYIIILY